MRKDVASGRPDATTDDPLAEVKVYVAGFHLVDVDGNDRAVSTEPG